MTALLHGKLPFSEPFPTLFARTRLPHLCYRKDPLRKAGASSKVKVIVSAAALRAESLKQILARKKCKPRRKAGSTRLSFESPLSVALTRQSVAPEFIRGNSDMHQLTFSVLSRTSLMSASICVAESGASFLVSSKTLSALTESPDA